MLGGGESAAHRIRNSVMVGGVMVVGVGVEGPGEELEVGEGEKGRRKSG